MYMCECVRASLCACECVHLCVSLRASVCASMCGRVSECVRSSTCVLLFQYEAEDHATAARQSLHGTRWPSSNPKILRVEYASEEEVGPTG